MAHCCGAQHVGVQCACRPNPGRISHWGFLRYALHTLASEAGNPGNVTPEVYPWLDCPVSISQLSAHLQSVERVLRRFGCSSRPSLLRPWHGRVGCFHASAAYQPCEADDASKRALLQYLPCLALPFFACQSVCQLIADKAMSQLHCRFFFFDLFFLHLLRYCHLAEGLS